MSSRHRTASRLRVIYPQDAVINYECSIHSASHAVLATKLCLAAWHKNLKSNKLKLYRAKQETVKNMC